jgi:hypothetical protein
MKHYELLRDCARMLQFADDQGGGPVYLTLTHAGPGRFPFAGGTTELLSVNRAGERNYRVPVKRIITAIGKAL